MLQKLKHNLTQDSVLQIVTIKFGNNTSYRVVTFENKTNNLRIIDQQDLEHQDQLFEVLKTKYPVVLSFTGKGILNKVVNKTPNYKSKALLNANLSDFYFYEYHSTKQVFLSIVRKNLIDDVINQFIAKKHLIVDYSLGPFSACLLKSFVESSYIQGYSTNIEFDNNNPIAFSTNESDKTLTLNNESLDSINTVLYSTAIQYFYKNPAIEYDNSFLSKNIEEKNYKRLFELVGGITLGLFFIALLVSYLLLGHYQNKQLEHSSSLELLNDSYTKIQNLEKERDLKRQILNESGVFTTNFLSFYINELTQNIPPSIQLKEFKLFPETKKIKSGEKIKFNANEIIIKGESNSNTKFNQWYKHLKEFKWVLNKETDIIKYKANKQNTYDFEIKIAIK